MVEIQWFKPLDRYWRFVHIIYYPNVPNILLLHEALCVKQKAAPAESVCGWLFFIYSSKIFVPELEHYVIFKCQFNELIVNVAP